jgi:hypothetical protein
MWTDRERFVLIKLTSHGGRQQSYRVRWGDENLPAAWFFLSKVQRARFLDLIYGTCIFPIYQKCKLSEFYFSIWLKNSVSINWICSF